MLLENQQGHVIDGEAVKCIRCGACRVVCPVFKELGEESYTARGKVFILRALLDGEIESTANIDDILSYCLLCMACVSVCPAGVKAGHLVEAARTIVVSRRGLSPAKRLAFQLTLKNRWLFNSFMAAIPGLQWLIFRKAPGGQGMLPRYPLGLDKRRLLRPAAKKNFRSLYPVYVKANKPDGKKVALFTGCMGNFIYPETAEAALRVLNTYHCDVIIPRDQHCCGTPARVSGEKDSAMVMAKINTDVFWSLLDKVDALVTICPTCGTALKKETPAMLAGDSDYGPKAAAIAEKTKDLAEFIVAQPGWQNNLRNRINSTVTYHDPCHLARGQGVFSQPREIITSIPGVRFAELSGSQACCGSAGTFSAFHYDVSTRITRRKILEISDTGADIVVTGCSSCRMQIEDGIYQANLPHKVIHTSELLWLACQHDSSC